jgi:hypothetical protein
MESLQNQVLSLTTKEWVKANFGDLRFKSTWQAALDRLSEAVAIVVDAATEALTSDTAKKIYTAALYFAVVLVVGLWLAAVHNWQTWVKPGAIVVWRWASDKAQVAMAQWMLTHYGV